MKLVQGIASLVVTVVMLYFVVTSTQRYFASQELEKQEQVDKAQEQKQEQKVADWRKDPQTAYYTAQGCAYNEYEDKYVCDAGTVDWDCKYKSDCDHSRTEHLANFDLISR